MTPDVRALFEADPGYLNTASLGVPPVAVVEAMHGALDAWRRGQLSPPDLDLHVERARTAWAALTGVAPEDVAIGATVSDLVGVIAAALPDGARVVVPHNEFTSMTFPFAAHADRGVRVEEVPLECLADLTGAADLIAVSSVQSADGRLMDLPGVLAAAKSSGARVLIDTTQSAGWLPLDVRGVDYVVCAAYKWLLCPRGVAFLYGAPDAMAGLRPTSASWYAGQDIWSSIYGLPLRLADGARKLDVSPAWFSWVGAAEALELLAGLDTAQIREHNVALADGLLQQLGLAPQGSAIVTVATTPDMGERLAKAGIRTAVRAGRLRASFHLYNDACDAERLAAVLQDCSGFADVQTCGGVT